MMVIVNGRELSLPARATVATLLVELGLEGPYALVERNGEPVNRDEYAVLELDPDDSIVVARPVAGG